MKKASILSATTISLLLLLSFTLPPCGRAHDQTGRGIKVKKVGATPAEAEKGNVQLWALIIGVSNYEHGDQEINGTTISNLAYATTDARAIYDFLQSDAGGGFRDVRNGGHMTLLEDEEATKAKVEEALESLKAAKPDDYFVIYVAAHGHIVTDTVRDSASEKESDVAVPYFVLHDTNPRDWKGTGLEMGWLRKVIESEIPARRGLVLLDTCHSGGIVSKGIRGSELANEKFHTELEKISRGVGFISASGALEYSFEKPDLDHGVFTYCLLEALRGSSDGVADKNRDGIVTFNEAEEYLKKRVPELTEGRQNPYTYTTWLDANYIPLSVVNYVGAAVPGANYATLVIRNPAVDGVEVAIDNEPPVIAPVGIEASTQVIPGAHKIYYSYKGTPRIELPITIKPGETKEIEIKLCFSEKDEGEARPGLPLNGYLQDKEPSPQAKDLFLKGVDSFNRQKFKEAYELFNRAIKASDGYSRAFVYRGRTEQSMGRMAAAVASFKEALRLKNTDFETQTLLAEAKFAVGGDIKEVYDSLKDVTSSYPTYDFAHLVLGDVLLWKKQTIRAERELRRAIALNPKSPPAHMILADALTYQNVKEKQKEAVTEATEALRLFEELWSKQVSFKGWSVSHLIIGGGRYVNQAAKAEAHYIMAKTLTRAVEYDPMLSERNSYLDRARVSIQESMKLAQGLDNKDRLAQVLVTSAQNYFLKGDLTRSITDGERALKLSNSVAHPELKALVHHALYRAYNGNQRCAKAAEHLQAYLAASGNIDQVERDRTTRELERLKNCAEANRQAG